MTSLGHKLQQKLPQVIAGLRLKSYVLLRSIIKWRRASVRTRFCWPDTDFLRLQDSKNIRLLVAVLATQFIAWQVTGIVPAPESRMALAKSFQHLDLVKHHFFFRCLPYLNLFLVPLQESGFQDADRSDNDRLWRRVQNLVVVFCFHFYKSSGIDARPQWQNACLGSRRTTSEVWGFSRIRGAKIVHFEMKKKRLNRSLLAGNRESVLLIILTILRMT